SCPGEAGSEKQKKGVRQLFDLEKLSDPFFVFLLTFFRKKSPDLFFLTWQGGGWGLHFRKGSRICFFHFLRAIRSKIAAISGSAAPRAAFSRWVRAAAESGVGSFAVGCRCGARRMRVITRFAGILQRWRAACRICGLACRAFAAQSGESAKKYKVASRKFARSQWARMLGGRKGHSKLFRDWISRAC
ncbi:MAG: hypothetical protein AAGA23_23250, partial [Pseudomonadota bacterium]